MSRYRWVSRPRSGHALPRSPTRRSFLIRIAPHSNYRTGENAAGISSLFSWRIGRTPVRAGPPGFLTDSSALVEILVHPGMDELVEPAEFARPAGRQGRELLASLDGLRPSLQNLRDIARAIGIGAHLIHVAGAVVAAAERAHEWRRVHDLGFLRHDEFPAAGHCVALGVLRHCGAHPRSMLQVVIGIDVDDLIKRAELGVPESPQFGVFLPQRQALGISLFKFGQGSGAQGIGTDFVDHRRILQVTGPARGTPAYRQPILTLMVSRVHPMAGTAQL